LPQLEARNRTPFTPSKRASNGLSPTDCQVGWVQSCPIASPMPSPIASPRFRPPGNRYKCNGYNGYNGYCIQLSSQVEKYFFSVTYGSGAWRIRQVKLVSPCFMTQ